MQNKVFIYLVRNQGTRAELLVLASHDEPGVEVPKGSVNPGESLKQAVFRELAEETGITSARIVKGLGSAVWQDENQHFFQLEATEVHPDTFEHTVTGNDVDHGLRYCFRWCRIDTDLATVLVQGCDRFIPELRRSV